MITNLYVFYGWLPTVYKQPIQADCIKVEVNHITCDVTVMMRFRDKTFFAIKFEAPKVATQGSHRRCFSPRDSRNESLVARENPTTVHPAQLRWQTHPSAYPLVFVSCRRATIAIKRKLTLRVHGGFTLIEWVRFSLGVYRNEKQSVWERRPDKIFGNYGCDRQVKSNSYAA